MGQAWPCFVTCSVAGRRWPPIPGWSRNSCMWSDDDGHQQVRGRLRAGAPDRNRCAPDDVALLERIRAGDERACEALVRQHGGRMLAVARRFLRTEEDSADAVQDAFLSAFRSLEGFQGNSALGTWLHRILVNVCIMRLRARSRSREARIDDLLPIFDETGHHSHPVRTWDDE